MNTPRRTPRHPRAFAFVLTFAWTLAACCAPPANAAGDATFTPEQIAFFESKIRPVLAAECYDCHGEKRQNNGLRLDSRAAVLKGADYGPVADVSNPDASKLLKAIRHEPGVEPMPKDGAKLPDHVIADFAEWMKRGMPWPDGPAAPVEPQTARKHWAFRPVVMPPVPEVKKHADRVLQPLDAFVLARLEREGLEPAPEADRATLIRRAYLTLLGFPPTYEEIQRFVRSDDPDAWPKLVNGLLDSPHYGERWARRWMDVARYADTKGYVFQEERRYPYAYTYRDWLIQAFNEDLPYDQFLIKQIAADLAPDREQRPRDLAAMGFLTLGRRFLNSIPDIIDDRIDTVFRGTQALTVACARCHDHKFDPIPTADYYSLYAVFNSSYEPDEKPLLGDAPPGPDRDAYEKELAEREGKVEALHQERYESLFREEDIARHLLMMKELDGRERRDFTETAKAKDVFPVAMERWLKMFKDRPADDPALALWRKLEPLRDDPAFAEKAAAVVASFTPDGPEQADAALLELFAKNPPADFAAAAKLYAKAMAAARAGDAAFAAFKPFLDAPDGIGGIDRETLRRSYSRRDTERLRALVSKVEELKATHPGAPPRAMVLLDKDQPVNANIFIRGNAGRLGPVVPRQFLEVLSPPDRKPFEHGSGRLEMARMIADKSNPLTARVFVNRVWGHLFGEPLVDSPGDFGVRTPPPDNPELLDALAAQFMEEGWSVKQLHRRILLSSTWKQSSVAPPEARAKDPENRLFARQNRRRLDFEALRDSLLRVTGRLNLTLYGRSVDLEAQPFTDRRTLYGFVDRQNLPSLFRTFDFASPDTTAPKRFETTVPQQALYMMNNPFVQTLSRLVIGDLEAVRKNDPVERVRVLYRAVLGRDPDEEEVALSLAAIEDLRREPRQTGSRWQNGYGFHDTEKGAVVFTPLPWFGHNRWSGGETLPDPKLGWVSLGADHGHPGDPGRAAIRRWNAPETVTVSVRGEIHVPSEQSGGVRALIVSSRAGVLGDWKVPGGGRVNAEVENVRLEAGDTLDFIVDCDADSSFDSFHWSPRLLAAGAGGAAVTLADAKEDFGGPGLTAWEAYAQVLLCSNEFLFMD